MEATKFRKKPVVIEAMQFPYAGEDSASRAHDITVWMSANLYPALIGNTLEPDTLRYHDQIDGDDSRPDKGWFIRPDDGALMIRTLEGDMAVGLGDYIIRGVQGEFYPIKESIFRETYEPVEEPTP